VRAIAFPWPALDAAEIKYQLCGDNDLAFAASPVKKSATEVAPGSGVPLARSPSVFARPNFGINSAVLCAPCVAELAA
jgi:hypothetical protein